MPEVSPLLGVSMPLSLGLCLSASGSLSPCSNLSLGERLPLSQSPLLSPRHLSICISRRISAPWGFSTSVTLPRVSLFCRLPPLFLACLSLSLFLLGVSLGLSRRLLLSSSCPSNLTSLSCFSASAACLLGCLYLCTSDSPPLSRVPISLCVSTSLPGSRPLHLSLSLGVSPHLTSSPPGLRLVAPLPPLPRPHHPLPPHLSACPGPAGPPPRSQAPALELRVSTPVAAAGRGGGGRGRQ